MKWSETITCKKNIYKSNFLKYGKSRKFMANFKCTKLIRLASVHKRLGQAVSVSVDWFRNVCKVNIAFSNNNEYKMKYLSWGEQKKIFS